jgi:predicted O-linked N-acetylglucosamine transferase (SPINDLY family)
MNDWHLQAQHFLAAKDYGQAARLYAQAIAAEPDAIAHYWHLGLMQLLQKQEVEAQTTWLEGMSECESRDSSTQFSLWTSDLVTVLQTEATRQESAGDFELAWLVRRHSHEIDASNVDNLLRMVQLSIKLQTFAESDLLDLQVIETLQNATVSSIDPDLLMELVTAALAYAPLYPLLPVFVEACAPHVFYPQAFVMQLISASVEIGCFQQQPELAVRLLEIAQRFAPEEPEVLHHLSPLYRIIGQSEKNIATARLYCSLTKEFASKVFASHLLLKSLLGAGGHWQEAVEVFQKHKLLILSLLQEYPTNLELARVMRLYLPGYYAPYFNDEPRNAHLLQNQLAQLCQDNIKVRAKEPTERYQKSHATRSSQVQHSRPLKIGYLSHCFKTHSVGWLARWLIKYHDREKFKIFGYFAPYLKSDDPLQAWYVNQVDRAYRAGVDGSGEPLDVAERIFQDEIDILIELDSITSDQTCGIVALKPAPVQVTWLGCDASGIPAIDYFIADPYVLPDRAQEYYTETIWRLPNTYIAVDGFEVAVPSLRRDLLDIPNDAVIYLSAQTGYKRHPDTVRLQMRIIKVVSNSYFLIKGLEDRQPVRDSFLQIAEEEGVSSDRLRFLPPTAIEAIHRANMGIADVILDTYPYNGATTTLEALWMGVPLVTRVGEQFFARYSYTMMMNAGITEGIARTDEEYVEWGIRLGMDAKLRQQISQRLLQSRQTSPLWNAQSFTREMEAAYSQMWLKYLENR